MDLLSFAIQPSSSGWEPGTVLILVWWNRLCNCLGFGGTRPLAEITILLKPTSDGEMRVISAFRTPHLFLYLGSPLSSWQDPSPLGCLGMRTLPLLQKVSELRTRMILGFPARPQPRPLCPLDQALRGFIIESIRLENLELNKIPIW